jgi:hypothetical protein
MAQQPLYTQITSNPFAYGMPSVTMGVAGNFFTNNMVPSMPTSSRVPPNNFKPSQFGNAHIPLSNPTLGSAFAQTGAQVESNPMLGGGFIPQSYTHYGNVVSTGINYIPQTGSSFGNPSILGGRCLETTHITVLICSRNSSPSLGAIFQVSMLLEEDPVPINSNKIGTRSNLQKSCSWPL